VRPLSVGVVEEEDKVRSISVPGWGVGRGVARFKDARSTVSRNSMAASY